MNKIYLTCLKCLCIVILFLSGHNNAIAQPNYTANDQVIPYEGLFEYGTNLGYYPGWTDAQLGDLAAGNPALNLPGVGATALRPALFEHFTQAYGNNINIPAYEHYQDLGMGNHTMFLGYASDAHRDPNFNCNHFEPTRVFANMYEPIWDGGANGTPVNDDNYYALFLYEIVTLYKPYIKYWEIWNEPDLDFSQGGIGWRPPGDPAGNWWDADPENCDIQWGAPIEYYNRLMRISWEVIKSIDPDSYVTVGGLGYPSFLDAMMRNTDNPVDGSVTADYPLKGGAYFDVLSFHSYPHINGSLQYYDQATNSVILTRNSDRASKGIIEDMYDFKSVLVNYGYDGVTYPEKEFIMTESNVPRKKFGDYIGSEMAQVNYLIKLPIDLQKENVRQFHVYDLGEKASYANAQAPFDMTGLYENPIGETFSSIQRTNGGIAYKTVSDQLYGKTYDSGQTAAMNLPPDIDGAAFRNSNNEYTYVLWAITQLDDTEDASATYSFPSNFNLNNLERMAWDFSLTSQKTFISFDNIPLTGSPIFLKESNQQLTVACPSDINVNAVGTNQSVVVNWNPPASSTICSNGNIYVNQTGGQPSGSLFTIGTHTVTYQINDDCGNSRTCTFTVIVDPPSSGPFSCPNGQHVLNIDVEGNGTVEVQYISPSSASDFCSTNCDYCVASGALIKLVAQPNPGETFQGWSNGGCNGTGDCWKTITWATEITATFSNNNSTTPPTITADVTNINCNGDTDGSITTTTQGGTPNYSYQWNNGQTSANLSGLSSGTYTVTVTDASGLTATVSNTVIEPSVLNYQLAWLDDATCSSIADGSASVTAFGGTPPYAYAWSNGVGNNSVAGLSSGTYTVSIYDANSCTISTSININADSETPVADFAKTINNLTVDFADLSSNNPITWSWDFGDGNSSNIANPSHTYALAGSYLACVTSANDCGSNTFCQNISVGNSNDISMTLGTTSANSGTVVQIAMSVEGFENVVSFQHAVSLADTSKAEFVGIGSFDVALNSAVTNVDPEFVSIVWLTGNAPVTIVDGTAIYYLDVLIKGNPNECVEMIIDGSIMPVEFIVIDNGNVVQVPFNSNNSEVCSSPGILVDGLIARENGTPIKNVEIFNGSVLDAITTGNGLFEMPPYALGSNIVIEPHKDINHVNGVTSFDLAIIQQHIVGNAPLTSPYQIIAADINNSEDITAFDLFLAQQVIVGNDTIFPNNESWRFVPAVHTFQNQNDPWLGGFPESITISNSTTSYTDKDFVAIKVGDVNNSALSHDFNGSGTAGDTRSVEGDFEFFIMKNVESGYIEFSAKDFTNMSAFQFDLLFEKNKIEFDRVEAQEINVAHGSSLLENGVLTLSWYDKSGKTIGKTFDDNTPLFRIYFNKIQNTLDAVTDLIRITETNTPPNAYTSDGSPKEIYLKPFISETEESQLSFEFDVLQNQPNPFDSKTEIIFILPNEELVVIEILDSQGQLVNRVEQIFQKGKNVLEINSNELPHHGVYFFHVKTLSQERVGKMIFIK